MHIMPRQRGASLIEVMVAVTLLGFGLLGLAGIQTKMVILNDSTYNLSVAADLSNDLGDRIRAVRTPFMVNVDANPQPPKPPDFSKCTMLASTGAVTCVAQNTDRATYQALAVSEMTQWAALVRTQLPEASYTLLQEGGNSSDYLRYTLTLTWLDDRATASNATYQVVLE